MTRLRLTFLTVLSMAAFAGNSLLCRQALQETTIDSASFTTVRLISGALTLWLMVAARSRLRVTGGSWPSAFALFAYAAGFSFAYTWLSAATGALLLFGAVQATMIGHGLWSGDRFSPVQIIGLVLALGGFTTLLWPGLSAPPMSGTLLMLGAGVAWGVYSLRGRPETNPLDATAGNFLRAVPIALALTAVTLHGAMLDAAGLGYAIVSGALTSGIGYAVWYAALPALKATQAATVQLSVPVITAFGGACLLGESITWRLGLASAAVLGGIAVVVVDKRTSSGAGYMDHRNGPFQPRR